MSTEPTVRARLHRVARRDRAGRSPICTRRSSRSCSAINGTLDKTENWGRRKLAYEIGQSPRGHLRRRDHHRLGRADEGNRSPPARDRPGHPPPRRPRRRGAARGGADCATRARRRRRGAARRAACRRSRSRAKAAAATGRSGRRLGWEWRFSDERRTRRGGRGRGGKKDDKDKGKGGDAPRRRVLPPAPRLQVLRGEDRLHQLQGRAAAGAVPPGARQDPAAPDLGHLRACTSASCRPRSSARGSWR